jgi:hypothetical protein
MLYLFQQKKKKEVQTMIEKSYYIENTNALDEAIVTIMNSFSCMVELETVEMNYSKVTIETDRIEDIANIERVLAPLM